MRLLAATLAGLILLLAGAVGWWTARPPATPITVVRSARPPAQVAPSLTPGGGGLPALAYGLMDVTDPPAPEGEAPPPPRYIPPPPPDAAMIFRHQLTAVVAAPDGRSYYALLNQGEGSQVLRVGQPFLGGWRLRSLSLSEAVLARGGERRTIVLFNPDRTASAAPSAQAAPDPLPPPESESSSGSGASGEGLS